MPSVVFSYWVTSGKKAEAIIHSCIQNLSSKYLSACVVKVLVAQLCRLSCDPMICSPLRKSMGFPRQEYWSGWPFPSPGHLPNPGTEPRSPSLLTDSLPSDHQGTPIWLPNKCQVLFQMSGIQMNKRRLNPCHLELTFWWGWETNNKPNTQLNAIACKQFCMSFGGQEIQHWERSEV